VLTLRRLHVGEEFTYPRVLGQQDVDDVAFGFLHWATHCSSSVSSTALCVLPGNTPMNRRGAVSGRIRQNGNLLLSRL
jgi:hypothetical protein